MKRILVFLFLITAGLSVSAQDQAVKTFWDDPIADPYWPLYVVTSLIFVTIILVLVVAVYLLNVLNSLTRKAEEERMEAKGLTYTPQPSMATSFWNRINALRPLEEEGKLQLDHNYDGIHELDNHLPPWWTFLFYITIIWGAGYLIVYHVSKSLPLSAQEYEASVESAEKAKLAYLATQPKVAIDEATLVFTKDADIIAKGKAIYDVNCQTCHRGDGGGGVGPNLTDAYWIHGGDVKNIYSTIKNGVTEKGMVSWNGLLSPEQIRNVTFYVKSLEGTNPANGKAPQGILSTPKPDSVTVKSDTLTTATN